MIKSSKKPPSTPEPKQLASAQLQAVAGGEIKKIDSMKQEAGERFEDR